MLKKILLAFAILLACGGIVVYWQWNKPHLKAEKIKAVEVTADGIVKEFGTDEQAANKKYLNKVIEVSGTIGEVDKNQDGGLMLVLQTSDPMAGIQCAMRDKSCNATKGQQITIKGFCSGSGIAGVSLTDCIIN